MQKGLQPKQINEKNLLLHAVAFVLFVIATFIQDMFFIMMTLDQGPNHDRAEAHYLIVTNICGLISFAGMLVLCKILY